MTNRDLFFLFIVIALFFMAISPSWLSDGMFMDGLIYAAVARNLAEGLGSFWEPHFSFTLFPVFHEHPPLALGLQGVFFRIAGDSIYVERLYSVGTFLITGFIMVLIWRRMTGRKEGSMVWLPVLCWTSVPLVGWAALNNMLENTMMIFTSLALLFLVKSLHKNRILYLSLAGACLLLGFLTKGFTALFPLSFPFWLWIFRKNYRFRHFLPDTITITLAMILPLLVLFLINPESYDSLLAYFHKQVSGSIQHAKTVNSRFYIVWKLCSELIPLIIIMGLTWFATRKTRFTLRGYAMEFILLFTGLSGVIPIMISMKQNGFYILATFPLFSLAAAGLISARATWLADKIKPGSTGHRIFRYVAILLLVISIALNLNQINRTGRDHDKIGDVRALLKHIPEKTIISIQPSLRTDWSLHGYFQRFGGISLSSRTPFNQSYLLTTKDYTDTILTSYRKLPVSLQLYECYVRDSD